MAACNPSELLDAAKCFSCLSKKELQAVIAPVWNPSTRAACSGAAVSKGS
jgi:hypothetical protein